MPKSVFKRLASSIGRVFVPKTIVKWMRGRYDAAQTSVENRNHWSMVDGLSPISANNPTVLRQLRNRSRYECANNSYASGMADTLANYVVGGGPRLQMQSGNADWDKTIEDLWEDWATKTGVTSQKLRTLRRAQTESGEGFGLFITNPRLSSVVKLDVQIMEGDQITSPQLILLGPNQVDGIEFDAYGNPSKYHILDHHPGDVSFSPAQYRTVPSEFVVHLRRPLRPGQARGIPEYTPVLGLFAILRRYTLAVLNSAEFAASASGVISSDAPVDDIDNGEDTSERPKEWDEVPVTRGMLLTLPAGWKMNQMKAENPTAGYSEFKHEVLNEICRCLNMPFNIAAGNSSDYNYASGRLDHQAFFRFIRISRDELTMQILNPTFNQWLQELARTDAIPMALKTVIRNGTFAPGHQWFWDGFEHVDPAKEASAQETRLRNNTTTLMAEYAAQGRDWEKELAQRAKEIEMMKKLGIPISSDSGSPVDDEEEELDEG